MKDTGILSKNLVRDFTRIPGFLSNERRGGIANYSKDKSIGIARSDSPAKKNVGTLGQRDNGGER